MATLGELVSVTSGRKGNIGRHSANRIAAASSGGIGMTVYLQGAGVTTDHFLAVAAMSDPIVRELVLYFGEATKEVAKQIHQPNIDSGETYDSISAGPDPGGPPAVFPADGGGWAIDVGPFTEYSVFQEFGFTHHLSGEWIQNPFMIPAADYIEPMFGDAMYQLAEIAGDRRWFTGPAAASGAGAVLGSFRGLLYSYSKFAGDIRILGFGGLSGSRGVALRGAQALGDLDAGMKGAIATRVSRRFVGRFSSGGISAVTSGSIVGPSSAFTGGSARIYNRVRGRVFGRSLRGI